jgi:hypothetical protein
MHCRAVQNELHCAEIPENASEKRKKWNFSAIHFRCNLANGQRYHQPANRRSELVLLLAIILNGNLVPTVEIMAKNVKSSFSSPLVCAWTESAPMDTQIGSLWGRKICQRRIGLLMVCQKIFPVDGKINEENLKKFPKMTKRATVARFVPNQNHWIKAQLKQ